MDSSLASAAAIADQRQKIEQYRHILASVLSSSPPDISQAKRFLDHMVSDEVPLVVSRQLLQTFAQDLGKLESDAQKEVAHYALTQIQPRVVSFEEQVVVIREKLAELYESEQQWSKAAQMLSGIDLDSGIRMLDDTNKLSKCVQIARLYLEDDDAVNAEAFINKASFLVTNSHQEVLNLQYKVCYARILDLKRRFLEAALRYYDISQIEQRKIGDEEIDENALEQALSAAVTCTILAGAGPQRSRVLATLYKDERCSKLKIYPILQKVYLERILRKPEIDAFAEELRPHQESFITR
uniref:PSMD12/CSN4-like N-terminal domain-containing protein n=1 Tax=Zea mays TaxID=4577 RepID=A0A804LFQ6_MAIZE